MLIALYLTTINPNFYLYINTSIYLEIGETNIRQWNYKIDRPRSGQNIYIGSI